MMGRLRDSWTREGPGVPKDAPAPTGLALLGTTIWREAWDLFVLNLLIALSCLPLITIPAAHAAGARVSLSMLRDQPIYLLRDYLAAFRALFWRATGVGAAAGLVLTGLLYALYIYGQLALQSPLFAAPLVILLGAALFVALSSMTAITRLAEGNAPTGMALIRDAALAALIRPLPLLGALGFVAALWLAHVLLYPASVFMPAVGNFSLGVLGVTFAARTALDRLPARHSVARTTHHHISRMEEETP